ncbi:MAG: DUF4097 family beta strand repeat-containing protein [Gemmatimonadales bacterium]
MKRALAAVALRVCSPLLSTGAQQVERHVLAGADVAIYNLAGVARLAPGTGRDVVVELTRGGRDAADLEIATGEIRGRETLRVLYPDDRVSYTPGRDYGGSSTLRVREDGTFGESGNDREFRGGGGRRVTVTTGRGGLEAYADLRITVPAGQKIAVYLGVGRVFVSNVAGELLVDVAAAEITAEGTRGSLNLDTGSGAIGVTGAEGPVRLDTGSGNVDATRVRGPGLSIDTGSGNVTVSDADVASLLVDTGSGSVDATAVRSREMSIDTGSGSVELALLGDVDRLEIDTGSGSVTVTMPASLGAEIEVETGSGSIDLGFPVELRRFARDHLIGKIGDGQGRITIETGSGSIRLVRG